jgi:hypothetical protein
MALRHPTLVFNVELSFLLGAAIVAPPPYGNPLRMFVSPLCDVGRRIHDALIERHVSQERKMLIFALTSTTLADLLTPLLRVDPGSAVRTSPRA